VFFWQHAFVLPVFSGKGSPKTDVIDPPTKENPAIVRLLEMIIEAVGIDLSFQGTRVLKNIDFKLQPGSIHSITGENGAGKSSLAKVFAGINTLDSGELRIDGKSVKFRTPREALASGIALIHQEPVLFPDLTLAENVFCGSLPKKGFGVDWKSMEKQTDENFDKLGLKLDPKQLATNLSIADQQMIELAAAMIHKIKVWIFDETSAPLTPVEKGRLFKIMRKLAEDGACVAMVSHHMDEVFALSDEITVLRDGEKVAHLQTQDTSQEEVIQRMVGRKLQVTPNEPIAKNAENSVVIKDLHTRDVNGVSFEIKSGEIFALSGLVGAGRTELAEAIFGIRSLKSGSVVLNAKELANLTLKERLQAGIAFVPEDRRLHGLFVGHSVETNSTLIAIRKFMDGLNFIQPKRTREGAELLAKNLKIKMSSVGQTVSTLSGGNQQKVVLSKWLHEDPEFLILDEPTRGVDIGAKSEVHDLIRSLSKKGIPILLISSDLPEVLTLAHRIGVMRRGELVKVLSREESSQDAIMRFAAG
jgi:rhamnose transport system ATP-binding protein